MHDTLTIVTVLKDGRHVLYQLHPEPQRSSFALGAHFALRRSYYGDRILRFVVIRGLEVSVEEARQ